MDSEAAREFAHQIRGMIGVNVRIPVPIAFHSFGGGKAGERVCLLGDYICMVRKGIRFYTNLKTITTGLTGIRAGAEFVLPTMGDFFGRRRMSSARI